MKHRICQVTSFEIVAPYTLRVDFNDDTTQTIDFSPVLEGEIYQPLRDLRTFEGVRLDSETGTLVWPNGADFDPATLHDWPQVVDEFTRMAREWKRRP